MPQNPRTRGRHIPAGLLSGAAAWRCSRSVCALAFVAGDAVVLAESVAAYLSLPVLVFLLGYSFTKRFTALAHFWLGAALMLAPVSAWIAIRGEQ